MFLIFNKDKIYTYIVSIITVVFLFCVANNINDEKENAIQTSANTENYIDGTNSVTDNRNTNINTDNDNVINTH